MTVLGFQPRFRDTNDRSNELGLGEMLFTGEGEQYINLDGTVRALHSVYVCESLPELFSVPPEHRSTKRIYRVGNNLYRLNDGVSTTLPTTTVDNWILLNPAVGLDGTIAGFWAGTNEELSMAHLQPGTIIFIKAG